MRLTVSYGIFEKLRISCFFAALPLSNRNNNTNDNLRLECVRGLRKRGNRVDRRPTPLPRDDNLIHLSLHCLRHDSYDEAGDIFVACSEFQHMKN